MYIFFLGLGHILSCKRNSTFESKSYFVSAEAVFLLLLLKVFNIWFVFGKLNYTPTNWYLCSSYKQCKMLCSQWFLDLEILKFIFLPTISDDRKSAAVRSLVLFCGSVMCKALRSSSSISAKLSRWSNPFWTNSCSKCCYKIKFV